MGELFGQFEKQPTGDARYVRVSVERGIDARETGQGLTYLAPDDVAVGQRVEVPLGRGNKAAAGIVVVVGGDELLDGVPPSKVKSVLRVSPAKIPENLVTLARWMSEYYVCPLGMVLSTMLPAAVKQSIGLRKQVEVERVDDGQAAAILAAVKLKPSAAKAWETVRSLDAPWPLPARDLATRIGAKTLGPVNALIASGLLTHVEREVVKARTPLWQQYRVEAARETGISLTDGQKRVADGVLTTLGKFGVHLLRGVTGSGKTEVYLRIIDRVLQSGGNAMVLVPEISLTPQTAGRFLDRFGTSAGVAVLHSGLTSAERHRQWALAASGHAKVIVGARSAVFAPVKGLGFIVVDEEHATDYKQDQLPRYNGRDVAIKRGQIEGCPVLLGSATPSLESWANATATPPRFTLWELTGRVGGGTLPRVDVVDLTAERKQFAIQTKRDPRFFPALGARLHSALKHTLHVGGQAILLLNRRGYSSYVCCPSPACGWVMKCEECDASMVLHRIVEPIRGSIVRCHHCLAEQMVPAKCPVCTRQTIALGVGTQKLEEELAAAFPELSSGVSLVRVDGDTMKSAADYFEILARFARNEVRVLLGTQMIAKGLDYPNVQLVGVVNADTGLALPDFRASERTFQLVSQVAGRTGRGDKPGLVIVQTVNPGDPAIELAARHDYRGFAERELELRKESGLPPVTRMARIVIRDEDYTKAQSHADELGRLLKESQTRDMVILGPGPAPIARIAGFHRFSIEVIAPTAQELHAALARLRMAGQLKSDARTAVDVDPVALM